MPNGLGESSLLANRDECRSVIERIQANDNYANTCEAHKALTAGVIALLRGRVADISVGLGYWSDNRWEERRIRWLTLRTVLRLAELGALAALGSYIVFG